ncbi:DUF4382 domain-containing protein [Natronospora cellulosivora (SeqCode)]
MKKYFSLFLLIVPILIFTGCSSILGNLNDGSGELALFIADRPVNNVDKVLVSLSEVQVKRDNSPWETINDFNEYDGEKEFDLLTLRFGEALLGQKTLPSGQYSEIRLIVAADEDGNPGLNAGKSRVIYNDGSEEAIFIPSGTQTGLKINHNFTIQDGSFTRLILDADVSKIMHAAGNSGNIILRSTAIEVVDKVISGNIEGRVVGDNNEDEINYEAIKDSDVLIQAIQEDEVIKSTVALANESIQLIDGEEVLKEAGTFFLRGLSEGNYKIKAFIVDDEGNEDLNSIYQSSTINDIEVKAEQTTLINEDIILEKR